MPCSWYKMLPVLAMLAIAGCTTPIHKGKSPLLPAQMSSDSVVLDIFFVRFPFGDPEVNEKLWGETDEQYFAPELRERLAHNGFRVGVIAGQMPTELSKLLAPRDAPPANGYTEGVSIDKIEANPRVTGHHIQLRAGQRSEVLASSVYDQLPVLVCDSGQLCGQTYYQAQGLFAVKPFPQPDGRVRLEVTPELCHDEPRRRWVGNQGMMVLESGRPRRVFDDMAISANLSPGSMLVLSSLPNLPGSVAHHFFTEKDSSQTQKLLVVRLSQTQHDELFDPLKPLELAEQ